jgi:hypothetical protein
MPGTFSISGVASPEMVAKRPPPASVASAATGGAIGSGLQVYSQLPGYQNSIANIGKAIESETAGQVPEDVINQLKEQGAEGNVVTGAASNAAYLRSLGLTSLGLEQQGAQTLEQTLPNLPGAPISQNPAYYQTQQQSYDAQLQQEIFRMQQQQQQFELEQQQEALAAAEGPTSAWRSKPVTSFASAGAQPYG